MTRNKSLCRTSYLKV